MGFVWVRQEVDGVMRMLCLSVSRGLLEVRDMENGTDGTNENLGTGEGKVASTMVRLIN